MKQSTLFQDGFYILQKEETQAIGRSRLKRYLQWLDEAQQDWRKPDLVAYATYLRRIQKLDSTTIARNLASIRRHYLAILSNPNNYTHVEAAARANFVNQILENLGYNVASISYDYLTSDSEGFASENMRVLLPPGAYVRDTILTAFIHWLDETNRHWSNPDVLHYKAHLQAQEYLPEDHIRNAIRVVRKRYHEIREDESLLQLLSKGQREAFSQDFRKNLAYADAYPTKDQANREMVEDDPYNQSWLTAQEVQALLQQLDTSSLTGLRDRAMIGLALATGIQQYEVAAVEAGDLRHQYRVEPALYIREGQLREARLVPYESFHFVLDWLDRWLKAAEIKSGPVFRGTYGNRDVLRPHAFHPNTASEILARYPIVMHGSAIPLLFTDLRATCARRWYDAGLSFEEIERRLALTARKTTLNIIGLRLRDVFA